MRVGSFYFLNFIALNCLGDFAALFPTLAMVGDKFSFRVLTSENFTKHQVWRHKEDDLKQGVESSEEFMIYAGRVVWVYWKKRINFCSVVRRR